MRKYQYDTEADIYEKLCEIERLLQVVAGLVTKEQYLERLEAQRKYQQLMEDGYEED